MSETKNVRNFTIGGTDQLIALLWDRGDAVEDIAQRYKLDAAAIEAALERCERDPTSRNSPKSR